MKKYVLLYLLLFPTLLALGQYNVRLNVDQLPELEADAGEGDTLCGLSAALSANSVTENGFWERVSGPGTTEFVPDENAPSAELTVSDEGFYKYVWTEDDGICTRTDTISVGFYEPPQADAGSDATIEEGESVQIGGNPTATGGSESYTYIWTPQSSLDDPYTDNPTATPVETTAYSVTVEDENGCMDTDTVIVKVNEATSILSFKEDQVKLYPNPAQNILFISFSPTIQEEYLIKLLNVHGQTLFTTLYQPQVFDKTFSIHLEDLQSGIYFLQLSDDQKICTKKIIVNKK